MTDPYVSFDTFSIGDGASEPTPQRPSLLARLPRVAPTPAKPKPIQRFDEAESPLHGAHAAESGGDFAMAGPAAPARRFTLSDPTATIRIDTVSPAIIDDESPEPRRKPAVTKSVASTTTSTVAVDDEWAAWLLNLESAIVPYSRLIVLAAVIAAMGLTLVLLRGGPVEVEAPTTAPQVSLEDADDTLVASGTTETAPAFWPTSIAPTESASLRPLGGPATASMAASTAAPTTFAAGPASAWQGAAGAKLTGQVLPVEESRVNIAEAPNYPQTTTR